MSESTNAARVGARSLAAALLTAAALGGSAATAGAAPTRRPPPAVTLTGSIVLVDRTWVCKGPVDLDSVAVTITANVRRRTDAVHLQPGCTGRIGDLEVTQSVADGVKVAGGVHDLLVGGGSVRCLAKAPRLHQDGIQVMGGERITFANVWIDCGRATERLIDSNFFVNRAGGSAASPSDVVCDGCTLGGWTAHTVNLQQSVRSGLRNSTLCVGRFPRLTLTIGPAAVDPVNSGNRIVAC